MRMLAAAAVFALAPHAWAAFVTDPSLVLSSYLSANNPTAIRFSGPNQGFFIEQGGAIKRFAGGTVSTVLSLDVATDNDERGLLGLALDPNFNTNGFLYTYHTVGTPAGVWIENRLSRHTWNGTSIVASDTLATFGSASDGQNNGPNHNGGPITFGPDGKLYGITGDLNRSGIEQNQSTTQSAFTGGIYRLNSDGSIPADNPFATPMTNTDVHRWYAYGVRNSFGLAFDPAFDDPANLRLWDTENGPTLYDEINLVPAGMNSGWTPIMGPNDLDPQDVGDLVNLAGPTYVDPKFSIEDSGGIAALGFLHGSSLAALGYGDAVIFGRFTSPELFILRLNAARDGFDLSGELADGVADSVASIPILGDEFGVITDIQTGPDGAIYLTALGDDVIYRIAPIPEPHTWALMLAGCALVGFVACRRRARLH